jgi:hypothetical protein
MIVAGRGMAVLFLAVQAMLNSAFGAEAESPYRIRSLSKVKGTEQVELEEKWRTDITDRIEVSLRVADPTPSDKVFVRAYFYDKDGALLHKFREPVKLWRHTKIGFEPVGMPAVLEKGKDTKVYFPITGELEVSKWKKVLVVFGTSTAAEARVYPTGSLEGLDFPERAFVNTAATPPK